MLTAKDTSLRVRLIELVLLAVLPALALILYNAGDQRRLARLKAENDVIRIVRVLAVSHERLIDSTRHLLLALARLAELRRADSKSCSTLLAELLPQYPHYTNLGAANANGDLICSARPVAKALNISDRAYFQRSVQTGEFAVGDYQIGRVSGKASLNVAAPIFDDAGEMQGIVFAGLDLTSFKRILPIAQLPDNSTLTVIDRRGTILARHPDPEKWIGKSTPDNDVFKKILANSDGFTEGIGLDGKKHLYGFTSVGQLSHKGELHIALGIPSEFTEADSELARNLTALVVVAILALTAAWFGGDFFVVRRLSALAATTERIASGDLRSRSGLPHSGSEIGRLAASLDKMAESLEEQRSEARAADERIRQSLERTKALHDIDLAITSTLDLHTMLHLLLEKIDVVLPNAVTTVRLLNHETGEFEGVACRNIDENTWRSRNIKTVQGFAEIIVTSRKPLTVADARTDPRNAAVEFARKFGLVSYHGVPLIAKNELLGVIAFYTKEGHSFSTEELEFLNAVAGQSAIAIHNSKLYEAAKRSEGEISALNALTVAATQSLNLNVVLNEAVRKITEIFNFGATRVFLLDGDTNELRVEAAYEAKPEFWAEARVFRVGQSVVGKVAETGQSFICEDIFHDPRYATMSESRSAQQAGTHFLAMFPIKTKLKSWGVMVCIGERPRRLQMSEISLLESMANQVGIAVENGTLYQQTASKAKELSALYSIAAIGSESLDITTVLHKTMHKVLEIFGFDAARIYLRVGSAPELHLVADAGIPEDALLIKKYQIGEGRVAEAFQAGQPMIVEDMQTDPAYNKLSHNKVMFKAGFRSSFLIPIKVRGESLGVMNFLGKKPHKFFESDLQLMNSIAYSLGIAVGNANLFSEIKQKTLELEEANRGKDEFLGVISHELRTPLNVIKGYTELLQTQVFGVVNPEQEKALIKICNQTKDLLSMINHVLQVTTIQAAAVKVNSVEVNLCQLLDDLRSNYDIPMAGEVKFAWNYSRDLPVIVTDDEKLKAVIQNLINNAVKFTERGTISVSVKNVGDTLEIRVEDTGLGIPKQKLKSVFDMFQQVDSSTTRRHGGIGLGLYIVKTFTELLGGRVVLDSEVGKGSVFCVTMPIVKPNENVATPPFL